MKLQIALEYMIVLSFVLLVFLLVFVTISSQRSLVSNQQIFSHLQLVAEDIASQINGAAQGGNGYSASVQLPSSGGLLNYNVSVTQSGEVLVSTKIASQVVTATAYADAPGGVESSSAFLPSPSSRIYNLQISNGTLYLYNYYGAVCVDYTCPNSTAQGSLVSLNAQVSHAAFFSGNNAYFSVPANPHPLQATLAAWVYPMQMSSQQAYAIYGSNDFSLYLNDFSSNAVCLADKAAGKYYCTSGHAALQTNNWTFIAAALPSSGSATIYINGAAFSTSTTATPMSCSFASIGFCAGSGGNGFAFNGYIANLQFYNISLSAAQAAKLYAGSIGANAVNGNVVGLWPLNQNPYDYSGSGDNANAVGYVPYAATARLVANVTNGAGGPVSGVLVGFLSSQGNLSGGNSIATTYTNANGIAYTYLIQRANGGNADVKAVAFEAGTWAQSNVVAWWPIAMGSGNVIYDVTGNGLSGALYNSIWSMPNFVASTGYQGSIAENPVSAYSIHGSITESAWVNLASVASSQNSPIITSTSNTYPMLYVQSGCGCFTFAVYPSSFLEAPSPVGARTNTWYLVTGVYNTTTGTAALYVNGVEVAWNTIATGVMQSQYGGGIAIGGSFVKGTYINGQVADAQIYSVALTSNQIERLYSEGLSGEPVLISSAAGWWPLDGDAVDHSKTGNNGIILGTATFAVPSDTSSLHNSSTLLAGYFNGANSMITLPPGYPEYPAANLTAAAWFQTTAYGVILWDGNAQQPGPATEFSPILYVNDTGYLSGGNYNGGFPFLTNDFVANGQWNFAAVVQNGTEQELYLNGQLVDTSAGQPQLVYPYNWTIGEGWSAAWPGRTLVSNVDRFYFHGSIAGVQIYNDSLSSSQVQQLYNGGVEGLPLENAGLVAWYPLDGNGSDYSIYSRGGTQTDLTFVAENTSGSSLFRSLGTYGVNFDSQNAYAIVPDNAQLQLSTLTLAGWVNYAGPVSPGAYYNWFVDKQNAWGVAACGNVLLVCYYDWGAGKEHDSSYSLSPGTWYYITAVIGSGKETVYVNGQQVLSNSLTVSNQGSGVQIGYGTGGQYMNGSAANLQIFKTAMTASQVYQLYKSQLPPSAETTVSLTWLP